MSEWQLGRRIDHVYSVVPDLGAAAVAARALGFHVTDQSVHMGYGTANRLIVLPGIYWELLGKRGIDSSPPWLLPLCNVPGVWGCALATGHVDQDRRALQAQGFEVAAVRALSRNVLVDGVGRRVSFRTADIAPIPGLRTRLLLCQHETPEQVWRPEWMQHPNGARAICVLGVEADCHDALRGLLALEPSPRGDTFAGSVILALSEAAGVRVQTPPAGPCSASIHRLAFLVPDLQVVATHLRAARIDASTESARELVVVHPALGDTVLAFREAAR